MNWHPLNLRSSAAVKRVTAVLLLIPSLLISASRAGDAPKDSVVASAAAAADGRPWQMLLIDGQRKFTLTLMPNGTGTMEPNTLAPELTWYQKADNLCLKPSPLKSEHCVTLLVRAGGYDAVENGALFLTLRR